MPGKERCFISKRADGVVKDSGDRKTSVISLNHSKSDKTFWPSQGIKLSPDDFEYNVKWNHFSKCLESRTLETAEMTVNFKPLARVRGTKLPLPVLATFVIHTLLIF